MYTLLQGTRKSGRAHVEHADRLLDEERVRPEAAGLRADENHPARELQRAESLPTRHRAAQARQAGR